MTDPANHTARHEIPVSGDASADIKRMLFKYLAYWKWFLLSLVLFSALGYCYVQTLTPQYQVSANILVKDGKNGGKSAMSVMEELDVFSSNSAAENEIEILRSYTLLEEVIDSLNLQVRYTVEDRWKRVRELYGSLPVKIEIVASTAELYAQPFTLRYDGQYVYLNERKYPCNSLVTESFGSLLITAKDSLPAAWGMDEPVTVTFIPKAALAESLRGSLQISMSDNKNTSIINISMLSAVPQRGMDIINTLTDIHNRASVAYKNNMAKITLEFINERLNLVGMDLQSAETKVEDYRVNEGITDIGAESSMFLQTVRQNGLELTKVSMQLDVLRQIEQYILDSSGSMAPATLGLNDPTLLSLISALTAADVERAKLLTTLQPGNPRVKAIDEQMQMLKGKIVDNIKVLRRGFESTGKHLRAENRRIESIIQSVPKKEREMVDLTRQQEIINQLYVYLLSKREETAIAHAATVADARVINYARSTTYPVQPKKRTVFLAFGLIGLLLPGGIIWLADMFKTTVSSRDELEKQLKAPVIGEISLAKQANRILIVNQERNRRQAEQIRSLRTNMEFMQAGGGIRVILVTSSISGEGKSFLCANIGAAFAVTGKKTAALGFDLRKPGLHRIFGINNDSGLSNYLAGQASLDEIIRETGISENLHVITCGHIAPNPQELLLGDTLPQLFEQLKARYDCIVIDTPPVELVSDAMILGHFADISLYVVRHGYTPKDRIRYINRLRSDRHLNNIGVVVNGIRNDKWSGYGYGYGYGSYKYYGKYYENN